jgi:dienelactone hydrolase
MYRRLVLSIAVLTFATATVPAQVATSATPLDYLAAPDAEPSSPLQSEITEDWTTISLAKSGIPDVAPGATLLSKTEMPGGCTRELRRLQWRPADPIDLYVIRPSGAAKVPVVLFLYNYTFDFDVFRDERWCARVLENGFAIAGFPPALSYARLHAPRPLKQYFVSELQEALATSTHDVQMILNYLGSRDDLDVDHVGVFGQGSGGAIAILAAAADSRIDTLDLMDPWGDWPDWLKESAQIPEEERTAYLKPEFLGRVANLDPISYLPQLKGRALRIHQVMSDPVTPATARDKIAAAAPAPDQVMRYPDGTAEAKALGKNGIVKWLGEQLNPQKTNEAAQPAGPSPAQK